MRAIERICLYVVVAFCAVSLLDRVRADEKEGGGGKPVPKVLTADEIHITNAEGNVVLHLGTTSNGGGKITVYRNDGRRVAELLARTDHDGELALYDESSTLRTNIGANDTGGYANFWNLKGDMAAYIGGDAKKEAGYVAVYGPKEKKGLELVVDKMGGVVSARHLENDVRVAALGVHSDGRGLVGVGTPDGKPGAAVFVTEDGGQMKVFNSQGKSAAFLGVSSSPAGNGLVYVANKAGQRTFETGINESNGGYVSLRNGLDKRIIYLGASTGNDANDGVVEVETKDAKLGVVLRAYRGGSSLRIYDNFGNVKKNIR